MANEAASHQGSMRCAWKGALSSRARPACAEKLAVPLHARHGNAGCGSSLPALLCKPKTLHVSLIQSITDQAPSIHPEECHGAAVAAVAHLLRPLAVEQVQHSTQHPRLEGSAAPGPQGYC